MLSTQWRIRSCAVRRSPCQNSRPSPSIVTIFATFSGNAPAYCSATPPPSECATIVYGGRPIASPSACRSRA